MHVYIYDTYVNQKKYHSLLTKIETRITDLGLSGKIIRLNETSSLFSAVENEIKKGVKTITVVGNNNILNNTINSILKIYNNKQVLNKNIPIGFIPIGKENNGLAEYLGISYEINACDVLASRRIEKIDLGKINNSFFLFQVNIQSLGTMLQIDDNYFIEITEKGIVEIINLPANNHVLKDVNYSVNDDLLEVYIKTKSGSFNKNTNISRIKFKKLKIFNKESSLIIDNSVEIKTPAEIEIADEKIYLIVGKNRKF